MPHAIKSVNEHGKDGLVAILMESQGLPESDLLGFMMKRFPTNKCMITPGSGLHTDKQPGSIPWAGLVGVDGTLLLQGNPNGMVKKFDDAIDAELKKIKTGWGKSPEVKKARAAMYGKGNLADAAQILDGAEKQIKDDAKDDFNAARAELQARYDIRKKGIKAVMETGRFLEAQKMAQDLAKGVKGKADWETEMAEALKEFEKPEVDKEVKLDRELQKIVASIGDKAPTDAHASSFKAFAKKNAGTKVGARAEAYAAAAVFKPK